VDQAGLEVDLLPAHRDELGDPKSMAVGKEDERPIARTVAAHLARGLQKLLDLAGVRYSRVRRSRLDCLRGG